MHSMARDFGDERVVLITTDKGITSRLELGNIRHLDTGLLWLLQLLKTPESEKPADVGTTDVAEKDIKRIMTKIGFRGRRIIFVKFSFMTKTMARSFDTETLRLLVTRSDFGTTFPISLLWFCQTKFNSLVSRIKLPCPLTVVSCYRQSNKSSLSWTSLQVCIAFVHALTHTSAPLSVVSPPLHT